MLSLVPRPFEGKGKTGKLTEVTVGQFILLKFYVVMVSLSLSITSPTD